MEQKIKLTIKGDRLSYEKEISEAVAIRILNICLNSVETETNPKTVSGDIVDNSLAGYLNEHAPKFNPEKILAMAGYLTEIKKQKFFSLNEIKGLFRDASEILPANFNRDFRLAINNGWIGRDTQKKENYFLTRQGSAVLSKGFSK